MRVKSARIYDFLADMMLRKRKLFLFFFVLAKTRYAILWPVSAENSRMTVVVASLNKVRKTFNKFQV